MKVDLLSISIVVSGTILLISIFFEEYLFGLDTPIMLLALGLILFALYKDYWSEKKGK